MSSSTHHRPYRPLWVRALNAGGRILGAVGIEVASVSETRLRRIAVRRTGYDDFGDESFAEGLRALIAAYQKNPRVTFVGRVFVRDMLLRRLENRLLIEATIRTDPAIAQQPIERPIFILGLPRTGTTLLHRLLAVDPGNRVPQTWEMHRPVPPPDAATYRNDPRIDLVEKDYTFLNRLSPGLRKIHEIGARLPEECLELFANSFMSDWFLVGLDLPEYAEWLYRTDLSSAYEDHRRQLQILQWRLRRQRWVLKAPMHLHGLPWLLQTYPDARIVQTHRDPFTALASAASLYTTTRDLFQDDIAPEQVGAEICERMGQWIGQAMKARDKAQPPARFTDVHYSELVADTMGEVHRIYDAFGIELDERTGRAMRAYLDHNRQHKHGAHHYSLEQFGLDAGEIRTRFSSYYRRFGVSAD